MVGFDSFFVGVVDTEIAFLVAPRTREGYYHYTGGVEVILNALWNFRQFLTCPSGRDQKDDGICAVCRPSMAGN
jgi:hypothetical protein